MAAREGLGFESEIQSYCASLSGCVLDMIEQGIELRCLRDLTRGGQATALVEIAQSSIEIQTKEREPFSIGSLVAVNLPKFQQNI